MEGVAFPMGSFCVLHGIIALQHGIVSMKKICDLTLGGSSGDITPYSSHFKCSFNKS